MLAGRPGPLRPRAAAWPFATNNQEAARLRSSNQPRRRGPRVLLDAARGGSGHVSAQAALPPHACGRAPTRSRAATSRVLRGDTIGRTHSLARDPAPATTGLGRTSPDDQLRRRNSLCRRCCTTTSRTHCGPSVRDIVDDLAPWAELVKALDQVQPFDDRLWRTTRPTPRSWPSGPRRVRWIRGQRGRNGRGC